MPPDPTPFAEPESPDAAHLAFAALVARFQGPLFGFLGRMGLPPRVAEEIAQESFLKAWQFRERHQDARGQWSTWLFAIARHEALHHLDSAAQRREHLQQGEAPEAASTEPGPQEHLERRQAQAWLQQALHRLSAQERSLIGLAYVQELDLASIARIEGCSVDAAKMRLHRARQRLKRLLEAAPDRPAHTSPSPLPQASKDAAP